MQKVYISSTYKDFKEYRSNLISLFQKQLKGKFELSEIMEHMYDDGSSATYVEECTEAVRECDIYFIILGNSVGSYPPGETRTYTEIEYETAIAEDKIIYRLQLDPIDEGAVDDTAKHKALRDSFEGKHLNFFRDETELESIFLKCLINHLKDINTENPYKGMEAYSIEDGPYFFGRDEEIERLIKVVLTSRDKRAFAITGNSGIGKSSFARAGLLYRMLGDEKMGFSDFIPLVFEPGNRPLTNLKYHLRRFAGIHGQDLSAADFEGAKIILCVDQLEQLITHCRTPDELAEREVFMIALEDLATHPGIELLIFTTYRVDLAPELLKFPFLRDHCEEFRLKSFDHKGDSGDWEQDMRAILTGPAARNGVDMETDLLGSLLNELENLDGCLPFLQYTLHKLWDPKVLKDHTLKYSDYLKLTDSKGIMGMVLRHASSAVARITGKGKDRLREEVLRSMLLNLVEVNEDKRDVRLTLTKRELYEKLNVYDPLLVDEIFEDMVSGNTRLLHVTRGESPGGSAGEACVSLIHEAMVRKWGLLKGWIDERRAALHLQKRIKGDASDFFSKKGRVYRGKKLRAALLWRKDNRDLWDQEIFNFIGKGRNQEVVRYSIPVLIVALLVVLKFTYFDTQVRRDMFLNQVISGEPQRLKNFLDSDGQLDDPQRVRLAVGQLSELDGNVPLSYHIPMKRNIRYFEHIQSLWLSNRGRSTRFGEIVDEFDRFGVLQNFKDHLKDLTLQRLNKLESLDGISAFVSLDSLRILNNFALRFGDDLELPTGLRFLEFIDNDGTRRLPDMRELTGLDSLRVIGNDALTTLDNVAPGSLHSLTVSGNSKLGSISSLGRFPGLRYLDINYNDNLERVGGLAGLDSLAVLKVANNPVLQPLDSLGALASLKELTLGIPGMQAVANLPKGLRRLALVGNPELSSVDLEGLVELESLEIRDNFRMRYLPSVSGARSLKSVVISDLFYLKAIGGLSAAPTIESLHLSKLHPSVDQLGVAASLPNLKRFEVQGPFNYNFDLASGRERFEYRKLEELIYFGNDDREFVPDMANIPSLRRLVIRDNPSVVGFQRLKLEGLKQLELVGNERLTRFPELGDLPSLSGLVIRQNANLSQLPVFEGTGLDSLVLSGNPGIRNYERIGGLKELRHLVLEHERSSSLDSLAFLPELSKLETLILEKNSSLKSLGDISASQSLKKLVVSQNQSLTELPDLSVLSELEELVVKQNTHLSELPGLGGLIPGLFSLVVYGNPVSWNAQELQSLDWDATSLNGLEMDVDTFEDFFLKTGLLEDTSYLSRLKELRTLVIHTRAGRDLQELQLIWIRKANPNLEVRLEIE